MIFLFTDYDLIDEACLDSLLAKLPKGRRLKADKIKNYDSKVSCCLGYLLFLYALRQFSGSKKLPEFSYEEHGKPYIKEYPDIFFNISHCKGAAVCIMDRSPVGIDIERLRSVSPRVLHQVCSDEELELINKSESPQKDFIRLWTVKEALSKLSGDGMIFGSITGLNPKGHNVATTQISSDTYMTAASDDFSLKYDIINLKLSDLLNL